jgi:hypothetical protein
MSNTTNHTRTQDQPTARPGWPPHVERRGYPRLPVRLPAMLGILVPDQGMLPSYIPTTVCNITPVSMKVRAYLSHEAYLQLVSKPRYCRLNLTHPRLPVQLMGRAVWVEPEREVDDSDLWCNIGLYFEGMKPEDRARIERFIRMIIDDITLAADVELAG